MGKFLKYILLNEKKKQEEYNKEEDNNAISSSTDPHEIMTACFCIMDENDFKENNPNNKDAALLDKILVKLVQIASEEKSKVIGKNDKEVKAITTFKDKYAALAQAYSAAKEIRKNFKDKTTFVILTGRKWLSDVARFSGIENLKKFGIDSYGMKDFNSSDIILTNKPDIIGDSKSFNKFLGISLKKKESAKKAADPTMLNRSVTDALGINETVKNEIETAFNDFFNQTIKNNVDKLIPNNDTLDPMFKKLYDKSQKSSNAVPYKTVKSPEEVKQWFIDKCSKLNGDEWKTILSNKVGLMLDHPSKDNVRTIVNNALKRKGSVFEKLLKVILENADELAFALIQIIYKGDLCKLLANQFDFGLCIGKGSYAKKKCIVEDAEYESIELIETAINKLRLESGEPNIIVSSKQSEFDEQNTAAKLFLDLRIGNHTIANVEVRYKGSYTSSPQFFATMSNEFKDFLKNNRWRE